MILTKIATVQEKVKPHELLHRVDADYYGYRDEEDGILLRYESKVEEMSMASICEIIDIF